MRKGKTPQGNFRGILSGTSVMPTFVLGDDERAAVRARRRDPARRTAGTAASAAALAGKGTPQAAIKIVHGHSESDSHEKSLHSEISKRG